MDPVPREAQGLVGIVEGPDSSVGEITSGRNLRAGLRSRRILYSLVESAKSSGADPIAYLTEVATRAQQSPGAVLLPADFGAQQG